MTGPTFTPSNRARREIASFRALIALDRQYGRAAFLMVVGVGNERYALDTGTVHGPRRRPNRYPRPFSGDGTGPAPR